LGCWSAGIINFLFQLCIVCGILVAQVVAYEVRSLQYGWRLVMGLASGPGLLFTIGVLLLPETPHWLLQAGRDEEAHRVLAHVRSTENIDEEVRVLLKVADSAGSAC
jgi:MFS family permease